MYRDYAANLLKTMRRRALDPAELTLDSKAGLAVVERLLTSRQVRDVRLGLDVLGGAEHPSLSEHLLNLATNGTADIQTEALSRIETRRLQEALSIVKSLIAADADPAVRGAAIRAYCALAEVEAVETSIPYLDSTQLDVRLGAAVGLLRYGSIPGVLAVGPRLTAWEHSREVDDRCFLAHVMGEVDQPYLYQPLLSLLVDPDLPVRRAALHATGRIKHPRLLPLVVDNLSDVATRSAAFEALVSYGDSMLPVVDKALSSGALSVEDTVRLVRACGQVKGERVPALMKPCLSHPVDAVRGQIMATLHACRFHAHADADELAMVNDVLCREVERAHCLLVAHKDVEGGEVAEPLGRALSDELSQARRRIFWLLSFMYDSRSLLSAETQLSHGRNSEQALALEMLDVTLSSAHKGLTFPLIDPKMEQVQRVQLLGGHFEAGSLSIEKRLLTLIQNADGQWAQPWTRACAIYAAAKSGLNGALPYIKAALDDHDPVIQETAAWAISVLEQEP